MAEQPNRPSLADYSPEDQRKLYWRKTLIQAVNKQLCRALGPPQERKRSLQDPFDALSDAIIAYDFSGIQVTVICPLEGRPFISPSTPQATNTAQTVIDSVWSPRQ